MLAPRGLTPVKYTPPEQLFHQFGLPDAHAFRHFYRLLQRYAVRLLFHDLFVKRTGAAASELAHYSSEAGVQKILKELAELGIVSEEAGRFYLPNRGEMRIGDLLELLVAFLLEEEFGMSALSGVSLAGGSSGGDYDVLADWAGKLLFMEVKSAPPKGIHNAEIAAFLERVLTLLPDLAVFIEDTHLRVKDKIVLMFEEELIGLNGIGSLRELPVERVSEQIFQIGHYIYIMNTRREIKNNLVVVFRDYLHYNSGVYQLLKHKNDGGISNG